MFFYRKDRLMAVRHGRHKAHFQTQDSYVPSSHIVTPHDPPLIFDLETDLGERRDIASSRPDLIKQMDQIRKTHMEEKPIAPSQLDRRLE